MLAGFTESGASLCPFINIIAGNHRSRNSDELILYSSSCSRKPWLQEDGNNHVYV